MSGGLDGIDGGMLTLDAHPLLDLRAFETRWPAPLGELAAPDWLTDLTAPGASTLPPAEDAQRLAVRDLLRHGGFKPAGRNKPCNEYIAAVAARDAFPRINAAVDATNVAVLHGGLPISTVDAEKLVGSLRVGLAQPGSAYVFNASGQVIDVSGLLCLIDDQGPCANAVKDAQRAKTDAGTTHTVTVIWGTTAAPGRAEAVARWLQELVERLGGVVRAMNA